MTAQTCIGCNGVFPEHDGPVHRYIQSSPGCWACYGEVLTREYSDPRYFALHRLTVDSYAVQHPGEPSPQAIRSIAIHLIGLCLVLEHGMPPEQATHAIGAALKFRDRFHWLTPPASRGLLTIADVAKSASAEQHAMFVRTWAECAWSAWKDHHATVAGWLPAEPQHRA